MSTSWKLSCRIALHFILLLPTVASMSTTAAASTSDLTATVAEPCTTDTPPPFLPCERSRGVFMYPGERFVDKSPSSCRIYTCFEYGLETVVGDCIKAMCVDAQSDECCDYCPNGQNCRLPNGTVISYPTLVDGVMWSCPWMIEWFGEVTEEDITAINGSFTPSY